MRIREISGAVVAITGASRGIGAAMAKAFSQQKCKLALSATNLPLLEEVADECIQCGASAILTHMADVSSEEDVASWSEAVHQELGPVEILINNAGILGARLPVAEYPTELFHQVLKVNIFGMFLTIRRFLPDMLHLGQGIIVNLSSELGRQTTSDCSAYVASEWAIEGFTQALGKELDDTGVIAVSVTPGMVNTDMLRDYMGDHAKHYPKPDHVGPAFVQLVKQLQPSQNGHHFDIDNFL